MIVFGSVCTLPSWLDEHVVFFCMVSLLFCARILSYFSLRLCDPYHPGRKLSVFFPVDSYPTSAAWAKLSFSLGEVSGQDLF